MARLFPGPSSLPSSSTPDSSYSAACKVCSTSARTEEAPLPCNTGSITHITQVGRWRFGTHGDDLICSTHVITATCLAGRARPYSNIVVSGVNGWMRRMAVGRTWTVVSFVQQQSTKYESPWAHEAILFVCRVFPCNLFPC
ncbi:Uncharacterized protein TCAP_03728, partial [Tolypocladium capitatum]